jgi:chorismate mutase/prephenate dehydratase
MARTLPELRVAIDALDIELLALLNQRAGLAHEVGEIKRIDGSPVFRPDRETQVINTLQTHNPGPLKNSSVAVIWREIMSACRALEAAQRVAYLGPAGTFSEQAAFQFLAPASNACLASVWMKCFAPRPQAAPSLAWCPSRTPPRA